ncbi:MAG TPA: hypothetical protein VFW19_13575 [Allosphingosinicella sp.]|nr:hypothetical protein [Allosphingosinicella sp.]
MHSISRFLVLAGAVVIGFTAQAQVTSNGPRSTAIGEVNGNVIVNGPSNAGINSLARKLDLLKKTGAISQDELRSLINLINSSIIPDLTSVRANTQEISDRLRKLEERLSIATEHPETAHDVLRPFLRPAFDLSNSSYDINQFLDAAGQAEYRLTFSLTGNCLLYVVPPRGAGFTVGYGIFSDHQSPIWRSLIGTQGPWKPLPLSTGVYQFVMRAKRGAGQYSATVSARCS